MKKKVNDVTLWEKNKSSNYMRGKNQKKTFSTPKKPSITLFITSYKKWKIKRNKKIKFEIWILLLFYISKYKLNFINKNE